MKKLMLSLLLVSAVSAASDQNIEDAKMDFDLRADIAECTIKGRVAEKFLVKRLAHTSLEDAIKEDRGGITDISLKLAVKAYRHNFSCSYPNQSKRVACENNVVFDFKSDIVTGCLKEKREYD